MVNRHTHVGNTVGANHEVSTSSKKRITQKLQMSLHSSQNIPPNLARWTRSGMLVRRHT